MKLKWMKKKVANNKNDCYKFISNRFDPERVFFFGTLYLYIKKQEGQDGPGSLT